MVAAARTTDGPLRDPTRRGRVAIGTVVAWTVCRAAQLFIFLRAAGPLARAGATPPGAVLQHLDEIDRAVFFPILDPLSIFAVLVGACWFYLTSRNAHCLRPDAAVSPPMTILWFVVPAANLFKPFQAVAQIWRISVSPSAPQDVPTPSPMRWCWASWLLCNALLCVEGNLARVAVRPEQQLLAHWFDVCVFPAEAATALTFCWLIHRLSALQRAMAHGATTG